MITAAQQAPFSSSGLTNPLLLAVALHGLLIFGLSFTLEKTPPPNSTIDVTLARHKADTRPEESDYIAQFDQQGSGTSKENKELTTDRIPPLESTLFRETELLQPMEQQLQQQNPVEQRIVTSARDASRLRDLAEEVLQEGSTLTNPQSVQEIASLRAKLAQQRQTYSKIPRKLILTAASAKASDHAEYLRQWIEWVEQVGNENYPEEARKKQIYGAIRLAVALERDGNVTSVEILQSSGQRVLDQAAIRIVRLAAPFAPIPPTIKEDLVEVIRTWNFLPGDQFNTSGQ